MAESHNRYKDGLLKGQRPNRADDPRALSFTTNMYPTFSIYPEELKLLCAFLRYTQTSWSHSAKYHLCIELRSDGNIVTHCPQPAWSNWVGFPLEEIVHHAIWGKYDGVYDAIPHLEFMSGLRDETLRFSNAAERWTSTIEVVKALGLEDVDDEGNGVWMDEVRDAYAAWYDGDGDGLKSFPLIPPRIKILHLDGDTRPYNHPRPAATDDKTKLASIWDVKSSVS